MMKKNFLPLIVMCALGYATAKANPDNDKALGLRTMVPVVLNIEQEPVYGEFVEEELSRYFRTTPRFDLSDEGYLQLKSDLKDVYLNDPGTPTEEKIDWIKAHIEKLAGKGVDAVLVAEVLMSEQVYRVSMVMVSTHDMEWMKPYEAFVSDKFSLQSFAMAVREGMGELEKEIPFDGTIIRRDGFRVVLDRGYPELKSGQTITAYTFEKEKYIENYKEKEGKPKLVETGLIQVTEAGEKLSFGKILVDKKPAEIVVGNKFLFADSAGTRDVASASSLYMSPMLGAVDLTMGGSLITITNTTASGEGSHDSTFFPGGAIRGVVWLNGRAFVDLALNFAFASVNSAGQSMNSNVSDIRGQIGYELVHADKGYIPRFSVRAGYLQHNVTVDASSDPLGFSSINFSGLYVGGGVGFDITSRWYTEFEVNGVIFPSVSESAQTSGSEVNHIGGWDFSLRANYHLAEKIDVLARLNFHNFSAEFSGIGTRPVPMASSSQSAKSFQMGVAYQF